MCGILNLPENDDVAVLGTVYKDMKLKPSILDEYVKVSREGTHAVKMYSSAVAFRAHSSAMATLGFQSCQCLWSHSRGQAGVQAAMQSSCPGTKAPH